MVFNDLKQTDANKIQTTQTEVQPCVKPPPMPVLCNQTIALCKTHYNH